MKYVYEACQSAACLPESANASSSCVRVVAVKLDVGVDGAASLLVATGGARPAFERFTVPAVGQPHAHAVLKATKVRVVLSLLRPRVIGQCVS